MNLESMFSSSPKMDFICSKTSISSGEICQSYKHYRKGRSKDDFYFTLQTQLLLFMLRVSKELTRETATPELYALPVRPIRCIYPEAISGMSKFITC